MRLQKASEVQCPTGIIALAINGDNKLPHCGIAYTAALGAVRLCDLLFEGSIRTEALPGNYYWTTVGLDAFEALQIMVFIELILERNRSLVPYSFLYSADGFDAVGRIHEGVGFTCATFVSSIFDHFKYHLVDLTTWRARPKQDLVFRAQIIKLAERFGYKAAANRLRSEPEHFRLKPWELFGSATHNRYPVTFCQAKKFAKIVAKLLKKHA